MKAFVIRKYESIQFKHDQDVEKTKQGLAPEPNLQICGGIYVQKNRGEHVRCPQGKVNKKNGIFTCKPRPEQIYDSGRGGDTQNDLKNRIEHTIRL